MNLEIRELPAKWQWIQLREICEINPRRPSNLKRTDDSQTTFVPMVAVDDTTGAIQNASIRPYGEIKKGYTYFAEGDVLFAKITPCMENGKHAVAKGLIDGIGFGSAEFHVLRPHSGLLAEWLHLFLRQPSVLFEAVSHFTGAVGQQRVPPKFLAELEIPLPSLLEQKRIAAILTDQLAAVERARKAAEEQLKVINALPAAILSQAFTGNF
jgi:type I restriction enzyme S subunit